MSQRNVLRYSHLGSRKYNILLFSISGRQTVTNGYHSMSPGDEIGKPNGFCMKSS